MEKKTYCKPELVIHGDVEQITQTSSLPNADTPGGADGTAFSPG